MLLYNTKKKICQDAHIRLYDVRSILTYFPLFLILHTANYKAV